MPSLRLSDFSFTPRWTSSSAGLVDGSAFADFLLSYPTTAQVGLGRAAMDSSYYVGAFLRARQLAGHANTQDRRWTSLRIQPEHDRRNQPDRGDRYLRA